MAIPEVIKLTRSAKVISSRWQVEGTYPIMVRYWKKPKYQRSVKSQTNSGSRQSLPPYYNVSYATIRKGETNLRSDDLPDGHTAQSVEASYHDPSSAYMEKHPGEIRFRIRFGALLGYHRVRCRVDRLASGLDFGTGLRHRAWGYRLVGEDERGEVDT